MGNLVRRMVARWDFPREIGEAVGIIWHGLGTKLALAIFLADLFFILLHVAAVNGVIGGNERLFRVDKDRSLSEWFEYAKLFVSFLLIFYLSVSRKFYQIMPMALVIFYLCLDDSLRLHEYMGDVLVPAHDNVGQALFTMMVGAATVVMAAIGCMLSQRPGRIQIISVLLPILLLGGFGSIVDAFHEVMMRFVPRADNLIGFIEDGGELVSMSVLLLTCVRLADLGVRQKSEHPTITRGIFNSAAMRKWRA